MSVASVKEFTFLDKSTEEQLTVNIPEVLNASYGLYVWPSAPVLAQYVWGRRGELAGRAVLEIGAGTALPGIVAAKCGAKVTLSDARALEDCLQRCRASAAANGLPGIPVIALTWGLVTSDLLDLPPQDIVLASDCFYDPKDFEDIMMTLSYLLHTNPAAEVWCSYQVRSRARSIEVLLAKWKLQGEQMDLPDMATLGASGSHGGQEVELYKITRLPT